MSTSFKRASASVVMGMLAATLAAGCDNSGASPNMKCSDFLTLSSDQQQSVWKDAAKAANRPQVGSGGGFANAISVCQDSLDSSVVDVAKEVSPY